MNASQSPNVKPMVVKKIAMVMVVAMKMIKLVRLSVNAMKALKMMALITVASVETQCLHIHSVKVPGLGLFNNQSIAVISCQQDFPHICTKLI